jgi:phosphoadenosine phosphosulfate reductase
MRRSTAEPHSIRAAIVGVSCGKDATATLDLCHKHLDRVEAYFLYLVPGLEFQERYLSYLERRYSIKILRLPHWGLTDLFRGNTFRFARRASTEVRRLKAKDIDAYVRKQTGIDWIATGEKACDSVERNAMIRQANGINPLRRHFWPLAFWQQSTVYNYLKTNSIALPPDYSLSSRDVKNRTSMSFGDLWYKNLAWIRDRFPRDFAKIVELFPMVPAQICKYERALKQGAVSGQEETGGVV